MKIPFSSASLYAWQQAVKERATLRQCTAWPLVCASRCASDTPKRVVHDTLGGEEGQTHDDSVDSDVHHNLSSPANMHFFSQHRFGHSRTLSLRRSTSSHGTSPKHLREAKARTTTTHNIKTCGLPSSCRCQVSFCNTRKQANT